MLPKNTVKKFNVRAPFVVMQSSPYDFHRLANSNQFNETIYDDFYSHDVCQGENKIDAIRGLQAETKLSRMFFSKKNIDRLQKTLQKEVLKRTLGRYKISRQNDDDLIIVMRSIFIQHARNLPVNILDQINDLNFLVIDEITPGVIIEVEKYKSYMKDAFGPLELIDRPVSDRIKKDVPPYI